MPVSWPSPFITVQKQIYRLRIALFPYTAMITKQRVCNGTLKVKVNLRFFLTGPSHFPRLSRAIRRCMLRQGYRGVVAYIDDFFLSQHEQAIRRCMLRKGFRGVVAYIDGFFIAAATYEEYRKWMDILIKLLRKLGFLISWKKVVGPSQRRSPSWVSTRAKTTSSNSSSNSSTSVHASAPANSNCRV